MAGAAILSLGLVGAGTNNARLAGMLRNLASYYYKDPSQLFMVRIAQGLVHMGKGLLTLNPYHSDHTLLNGEAQVFFFQLHATVPRTANRQGRLLLEPAAGLSCPGAPACVGSSMCMHCVVSSSHCFCPHPAFIACIVPARISPITAAPHSLCAGTALAGILAVLLAGGLDMKATLAVRSGRAGSCLAHRHAMPAVLPGCGRSCAPLPRPTH